MNKTIKINNNNYVCKAPHYKILIISYSFTGLATPSLSSLPRLFHPPFSPSALRESGEEARRRVNGQGNKELSYFMSVLRE